jgi:hypothetical protein
MTIPMLLRSARNWRSDIGGWALHPHDSIDHSVEIEYMPGRTITEGRLGNGGSSDWRGETMPPVAQSSDGAGLRTLAVEGAHSVPHGVSGDILLELVSRAKAAAWVANVRFFRAGSFLTSAPAGFRVVVGLLLQDIDRSRYH